MSLGDWGQLTDRARATRVERGVRELLALQLWADTSDEPFAAQAPPRQAEFRDRAAAIMRGECERTTRPPPREADEN